MLERAHLHKMWLPTNGTAVLMPTQRHLKPKNCHRGQPDSYVMASRSIFKKIEQLQTHVYSLQSLRHLQDRLTEPWKNTQPSNGCWRCQLIGVMDRKPIRVTKKIEDLYKIIIQAYLTATEYPATRGHILVKSGQDILQVTS